MSFDADAVSALFDRVQSHAMDLGLFDNVNTHEAKSAPGRGLNAAIWVQYLGPFPPGSGLAATTGLVVLTMRIYCPAFQQPLDAIDPAVLSAVAVVIGAYSGDFDLGATVRNVDLLGMSGQRLEARAGYLQLDTKMSRVMDITIPVIINDMFTQAG